MTNPGVPLDWTYTVLEFLSYLMLAAFGFLAVYGVVFLLAIAAGAGFRRGWTGPPRRDTLPTGRNAPSLPRVPVQRSERPQQSVGGQDGAEWPAQLWRDKETGRRVR